MLLNPRCHVISSPGKWVGREDRIVEDPRLGLAAEKKDGGLLGQVAPSRPVVFDPWRRLVGLHDPLIGLLDESAGIGRVP